MQLPRAREILFNVTLSSVVSVFSVATFLSAAAAQSRPAVDRGAASIYRQLLPQIERIRIFDHHAHPAFPNDPDVDAAPPPLGAGLDGRSIFREPLMRGGARQRDEVAVPIAGDEHAGFLEQLAGRGHVIRGRFGRAQAGKA